GKYLVIIISWQRCQSVSVGTAHFLFGLGIIELKISKCDRPVQKIRAVNATICRTSCEFVSLKSRSGTGPVRRRATYCLDYPCWQVGEILCDPPGARSSPWIEPCHLVEGF